MKRFRDDDDDDVLVDSEPKRPAISPRVEQPGHVAQMPNASSGPKLTTNDALSFLKTVKEFFEAEKDNKYDVFLKVMKDFKAQRVDTRGVISRVKELFKGNRDLILGFNTFLPKGHEIKLPLEDEQLPEKSPVRIEDAIAFVIKMKARFSDNVYRDFIDILRTYQNNNKSIPEFYREVSVLFENQADILVDFIHFLPGISSTVSAHYEQTLNNHIVNGDGRVSPMAIEWYNHVEKNLRDLEQWNHFEKDEIKKEDEGKDDWEQEGRQGHKRKSACQDDQFRREMKDIELCFRNKVKDRLQEPEVAEKCSDCVRAFIDMVFTANDFRNLIYSLLGAHSDVMEACEDFLSYIEKNGSLRNNRQVLRTSKVKRERDYHDSQDTQKNKDHNIRIRDRHDRGLSSNAKDVLGQRIPCGSRENFLTNPIQELDLSNCECCTPSYRLLPENYPIPSARWRTEIGDEVLNDRWVSVTSGSEDYSFKHMRKNQYEESLFRCEDDRFELDMLLESVKATAKRVEELIDSMNARAVKTESAFCIEDHLTVLNLRCIERLYGDHGLDVLDVLRKNAPLALPVILARLKQKQREWARCRVDFNNVWAEIYAKNYHKSLDHRSFYFKQQDTKNLTTKALLARIKDLSSGDQTEDELLLSIYAGHLLPDKFHIEAKYLDPDIHEDVFQLLKYSCAEICTPEQSDQVLKTWSTIIEPMLGIPSRKGNDQASSGCGIPNQESQDGIIAKLTSCSIGTMREDLKAQKPNKETECGGKAEREEGELSPRRNPEGRNFSASANSEETCIEKAGAETYANGDDEGGQGSLESENGSGNGNVSETESPNGEGESGGHDKKAMSEGEAPFPDSLLLSVKPLNVKVPMALQDKERNSQVFYGNDSFYLLFVLHQMLYERLLKAKLASSPENRWMVPNDANLTDFYARFKDLLYTWLDGTIDNPKYEDECRTIIGSQSFTLFTLDKLIRKLVKQLQTIVTEKVDTMLLQLSDYERSRSCKAFTDAIYRVNARFLLQRDNMYRMEFFPSPMRMTIQLMNNYDEHDEFDPTYISKDHCYAEAYLNDDLLFVHPERKKKPGVFLKRNKRKYSTGDEGADFCKAMEGVIMHNCVGMRFACDTKKVTYVLGSEDFFYRPTKLKRVLK